jgi:hypothetical protein
VQRLEVDLGELVHLGAVAEGRLQFVRELRKEVDLGDPAALQLEQRVHAVVLLDLAHRLAQCLHGDAGLVLDRGERLDQRTGEDTSEVGDDGRDLGAHAARQIR